MAAFLGTNTYDEETVSSVSVRKLIIYKNSVMKRIFTALKNRPSQSEATVADDQSSDSVLVEDVVMPDIYGDEDVAAVPETKIIDQSSPDIEEPTGFNPYDTAVLRKK